MTYGFWEKLKKKKGTDPILMLAPMANVTDAAFRRLIAREGGLDVLWTEFVSADGLMHGRKDILLRDLLFTPAERPIVAQFFTADPEAMRASAALAVELGFDGVDINMGCPDRAVEKQGAGAALMKDPQRALEIIAAAKDGAGALPVSVKTRKGFNIDKTEEWIGTLLEGKPAAITLHARTRKEMSKVPADWQAVARAVAVAQGSGVLVFGNGDVETIEEARAKAVQTGADGVMFGRAIFGNPWLGSSRKAQDVPLEEKLRVMVEHTKLYEELLGDMKSFALMKKHYKAYVNGFDGAKELRMKLMDEAETAAQVEQIVEEYLNRR